LAVRGSIEAYDEYTDETVELKLGQDDPGSIQGLVIDFRYVSRDREVTRRSLLCWQCWRIADRIYVRGYCPFREELRTFRVDRMADVVAMKSERDMPIDDTRTFFAAFAADVTEEVSLHLLASADL
jgi:predicted DNA-binding transcriptional regulator YafY